MAYSLEYYKYRKKQTADKINRINKENQKLQGEIEQLEKAYQRLGNIKRNNPNNADWVRDQAKLSKVADNVQWRGKSKKEFDDVMKDQVKKAGKDFFDSIDKMQDEIGTAIAKKKGEKQYGIGIINGLNKTLNWLNGVIRNWTN